MFTIVVPAYNEAARIQPMLDAYVGYDFAWPVQFIVVVNGSTDDTLAIATDYATRFPQRVRVLHIPEAVGKGGAIVAGWGQASAEWVGFVDADGSTSPAEFAKIMAASQSHDGAIGSRFGKGAVVVDRQGWLRTVMSYAFANWVHIVFRMPFRDTQCGAKVFRRDVVAPLLDRLTSTMDMDVDLLWHLHKAGVDIIEVPTTWVDKPGSAALWSRKQFLRTGWQMVLGLVRIRLRS